MDQPAPEGGRASPWGALAAALQFLTIAPPLVRRPLTPAELGAAVGLFPLVGALLGGLLAASHWLLGLILPIGVAAVLTLVVWIGASGALHLDGWLDSLDGLFGGQTPEKRLEIMRDERVGAFALAGGVLLLLFKFSLLTNLHSPLPALFLAPVLGRAGMSLALVIFPYARPGGLGSTLKTHAGVWQAVIAGGIASGLIALIWLLSGDMRAAIALLATALVTWGAARFALLRLPGLTGDLYGAINELVESAVLLVWVVRW